MKVRRLLHLIAVVGIIVPIVLIHGCGGTSSSYWGSWVFDNSVRAIAASNGKVFVGGEFTKVWVNAGGGAYVDTATGMIVGKKKVLYIDGMVRAAEPDGAGGWYIGGDFHEVGGETRNHLARINADGSLNAWNPDMSDVVRTIVVSSNTVFVGGNFTNVYSTGGAPVERHYIAAFNKSDGSLNTTWDPAANGSVYCMVLSGSTLYVCGEFSGSSSIGGKNCNYIAALSTTGVGAARDWYPAPNNTVCAMALSGTTLFIGGFFTGVDTTPLHSPLAALDTTATSAGNYLISWEPEIDNIVLGMALSGTTLYVGGQFTAFNSVTLPAQARNHIAAINTTQIAGSYTSWLTAWNPNPNGSYIVDIACSGSLVYAAGSFTTIGGQTRGGVAALDAATGAASAVWDPRTSGGGVVGTCVNPTTKGVYIGGAFTSGVNVFNRNFLAGFDSATGLILPNWDPNMTGSIVRAIAVSNGTVYVGGNFTSVNGGARANLAALSATDGQALPLTMNVSGGEVFSLALSQTTLYAGGSFTAPQTRLARFNRSDGVVDATWHPDPGNIVRALALSGSTLYAGGDFSGGASIGQVTPVQRDYIAAVYTSGTHSGDATAWAPPSSDSVVTSMALNGTILYVGGYFTTIDSQDMHYVGALNTGATLPGDYARPWDPDANAEVHCLSYANGKLYVGGNFTTIDGGKAIPYLAKLDTKTSTAGSIADGTWVPTPQNLVLSVMASGNLVFAGGAFTTMSGLDWFTCMAAIDSATGLPFGY